MSYANIASMIYPILLSLVMVDNLLTKV